MSNILVLDKLVDKKLKDLHNELNMLQFLYTEKRHEMFDIKQRLLDVQKAMATLEQRRVA